MQCAIETRNREMTDQDLHVQNILLLFIVAMWMLNANPVLILILLAAGELMHYYDHRYIPYVPHLYVA